MRITCLAQGHNILLPGFEPSTSVSGNRHSNHMTNMLKVAAQALPPLRRKDVPTSGIQPSPRSRPTGSRMERRSAMNSDRLLMLLLALLINRQVEVFRGLGRHSPLRRAVEKVIFVMRRMTTVVAMVARCRVDYLHVLTKDSAVTGAQLCQYGSCLPWQCLFGCSNGRRSAIKQFL